MKKFRKVLAATIVSQYRLHGNETFKRSHATLEINNNYVVKLYEICTYFGRGTKIKFCTWLENHLSRLSHLAKTFPKRKCKIK